MAASGPSHSNGAQGSALRRWLLEKPVEGFRVHAGIFSIVNAAVLLCLIFIPAVRGYWWIIAVWGAVLGCHYVIARTIRIDKDWVDRRTDDLRMNSYDLGHIREIQAGYQDGHPIDRTQSDPKS